VNFHLVTRYDLVMDYSGCIDTGVLALAIRIFQDRGAELVIRMHVGMTHPFIDHLGHTHVTLPLDVHSNVQKDCHDTRILADRPMAFGAHTGIDQDLGHCIPGRRVGLLFVGFIQGLDKINRVVVGNIL